MLYRYVVAFQLIGVVRPNVDLEGFQIDLAANGLKARLTGDLNTLPQEVDQGAVIGNVLLRGLFRQDENDTAEDRLENEVKALKERRRKETGEGMFLVLEASGEVADFNPQPQRDLTHYSLAIYDAPKKSIRESYEPAIHGALAAFAIAAENLCRVKKIIDVITFVRLDGKPLFCITLSGSASAYVSSPLQQDALVRISNNAKTLSRHQSLADSARLLSRSFFEDDDPLLSFLSVWSGLEIFVNKNFKDYEKRLLERISNCNSPEIPVRFFERIRSVMTDKYRLADKFSVIACQLIGTTIDQDQADFESIKLVRDKLLHGEDIPLSALPTADARRVLRKYLRLHLDKNVR